MLIQFTEFSLISQFNGGEAIVCFGGRLFAALKITLKTQIIQAQLPN